MKMMTKEIKHHLLTIEVTEDIHLHSYLMTDDRRNIERAMNLMIDEAEKLGCKPLLPIMLITELGDGVDLVHQFMREKLPKEWETHQRADRFHLTMFALHLKGPCAPWDEKLMKLH